MTHALLRLMVNALNNSTFEETDLKLPTWTGPGTSTIWTQSILYASLSLCLLSALGAMLGKQWLGKYARIDVGGSAEDRRRSRQQKRDALRAWHFTTVMETMSALLQTALFLFGIAIGVLLWDQQRAIAGTVIGVTVLGSTFYLMILIASVVSPDCPFETHLSGILRALLKSLLPELPLRVSIHRLAEAAFPEPSGHLMRTLCVYTIYPVLLWIINKSNPYRPNWRRNRDQQLEIWEEAGRELVLLPPKLGVKRFSQYAQRVDSASIQWLLTKSTDDRVTLLALPLIEEPRWRVQGGLRPILLRLLDLYSRERYRRILYHVTDPERCSEDKAISLAKALLCIGYAIPQKELLDIKAELPGTSGAGEVLKFLQGEIYQRFRGGSIRQSHDRIPEALRPWMTYFMLLKLFDFKDGSQRSSLLLEQAVDVGICALCTRPLPADTVVANALLAVAISLGTIITKEEALLADKRRVYQK